MLTSAQAYARLAKPLQQFIYRHGWSELNALQIAALEPILAHHDDVVLSASTASGKTEAAFLPALTYVLQQQAPGFRILYISPLKALINDQARRLEDLTAHTDLEVTPWHGDVSSARKHKQLKDPAGIVLITPESLESLLLNHLTMLRTAVAHLDYIVIDEFHAFMGSQRGIQLMSQLHRLDNIAGRRIVRIALSATFSNIANIQPYLRPHTPHHPFTLIAPPNMHSDSLAIQLRGYEISQTPHDLELASNARPGSNQNNIPDGYRKIAHDIFRFLRGSNHLVFTNSRAKTEIIAGALKEISDRAQVPLEFYPHHGSLSKDLRESLELRLQEGRLPTTAICTSTLELGIDIADVVSIGQVDAPLSVASLRQRLGRSGRRTRQAALRLFIPECGDDTSISAQLCEETFLSVAVVKLLLERWYEPPALVEYSFSVLLQQTLSVIGSFGAASAQNLWALLCQTGPFYLVDKKIFATFLRSLAAADLIVQLNDGTLALGLKGEQLCSQWKFFAVFQNADEFIIDYDHRTIGRLPIVKLPDIDDTFLFAGQSWKIIYISSERRIIGVKPYDKTTEPLNAGSGDLLIADEICAYMKKLYLSKECPPFLNAKAKEHFARGIDYFTAYNLAQSPFVEAPQGIALFPFKGSRVLFTLVQLLRRELVHARQEGLHILIEYCSRDNLKQAVRNLLRHPPQKEVEIICKIRHLEENKYDEYIARPLQELDFAHRHLDLKGAYAFLKDLESAL